MQVTMAITDPSRPPEGWLSASVDLVRSRRVSWIQFRAKALPHGARSEAAATLADACRRHGVALMINTDLDIARTVGAQGLHLPAGAPRPPSETLEGLVLSRACHSLEDVLEAQRDSFDMVTLSPIFPPNSKHDKRAPLGLEGLNRVCSKVEIAIVALGGLDAERGRQCLEAGASGWAAIAHHFP